MDSHNTYKRHWVAYSLAVSGHFVDTGLFRQLELTVYLFKPMFQVLNILQLPWKHASLFSRSTCDVHANDDRTKLSYIVLSFRYARNS